MSRASRRREQARQVLGNLPPEQAGLIVALGVIYAPAVVILDLTLAAVLSRSLLRSWRARQHGLGSALRAGVNPALIGLVGALTVNEVIRALVLRTLIRPAFNRAAHSGSQAQPPSP
jgi:hypothetical protein